MNIQLREVSLRKNGSGNSFDDYGMARNEWDWDYILNDVL